MTTRVVHWRTEACDVRIDRGSIWGNPFKIGPDGVMAQVPTLRGKTLGCWCKPQACPGDVLAELANETSRLTSACKG